MVRLPKEPLVPRLAENTDTLTRDLAARLAKLVEIAKREGREAALADVRGLIGSGGGGAPRRGPGRPRGSKNARRPAAAKQAKSGRKRKNPWSGLTPEQKLARVNAIRKGRGLPPKE